jgi:hypothetical protein
MRDTSRIHPIIGEIENCEAMLKRGRDYLMCALSASSPSSDPTRLEMIEATRKQIWSIEKRTLETQSGIERIIDPTEPSMDEQR